MYFQNLENISINFFEDGAKMKIHLYEICLGLSCMMNKPETAKA